MAKRKFRLSTYIKEMEKLGIAEVSQDNSVALITDGAECFRQFFREIDHAKLSINLESYIFRSDGAGWDMAKRLAKASRRGVEVNVIFDALGSIKTSREIFRYMSESGVELIEYHPLVPWRKFFNITFRDHRKILVIDGKTAFIGGLNIGSEYAGSLYIEDYQRDTHMKITGPAVRDIQYHFIENWFHHGGRNTGSQKMFPNIEPEGSEKTLVLCANSRRKLKPIQESYLAAINGATSSIYIENAYFIPDLKTFRALVSAAKRGVDVRIILPGHYVMPFVSSAVRYLYKRYLKNDIKIYEYMKSVLHAKTAVIDGVWSTVGSSNIDRLSFGVNLEINGVVLGKSFGDQMKDVFFEDLEACREITLGHWQKRSPFTFLFQWLAYRFRNLL
jgi:cardiolipin synthase